jgi:hypothetical protein
MYTLPHTSPDHYLTGRAALNVPNPDGSFADWHFDEMFLSGRRTPRIAGIDTEQTDIYFGNYGIRECSEVLRRFGLNIPEQQKVYTATHIRALLDMVVFSLNKGKIPHHVSVLDLIDSDDEIEEIKTQVQQLKQKISNQITLSLLTQWEKTYLSN